MPAHKFKLKNIWWLVVHSSSVSEVNRDLFFSFHVGSNGANPELAFTDAIENARFVMDEGSKIGYFNMDLLDIGGGFPGYDTEEVSLGKVSLKF